MIDNDSFTFCIAHYNNSNLLDRCVNSINKICAGRKYEIIIVDDFSENEEYKKVISHFSSEPMIKVFRNSKNMGVSYTKNKAFNKSDFKWCIFIDCDDFFDYENGKRLLNEILKYNNYPILFSHCLSNNKDKSNDGREIEIEEYITKGTGEEALTIINKSLINKRPYYAQLRGCEGIGIFNLLERAEVKKSYILSTRARYYTSDSIIQISKGKLLKNRMVFLVKAHCITMKKYSNYLSLSRKIKLCFLIVYYFLRSRW